MGEELLHAEGLLSFEHEVDSPADLVGEDGERFALAVFADEAAEIVLGLFVVPEEEQAASENAHLRWTLPTLVFWCRTSFLLILGGI